MDFSKISDLELEKELYRRRQVLVSDGKGLSVIPLEFLISEYVKRKPNTWFDFNEMNLEEVKTNSEVYSVDIEAEEVEKEDVEVEKVLYNAIITPDGTFLSSYHRHDFKTHEDKKTGKRYGVDGGGSYFRGIGDLADCEVLYITNKTDFLEIREKFHWGSYGKKGGEPLTLNRLKNLENEHIINILKDVKFPADSSVKSWFEKEIMYRVDNNIVIG